VRVGSYAVGAEIAGLSASATFTVVPGDCVGEPGPATGPGAFTLSRVSCEVASLGRLAKISWTPSSGADRYRVMMHEWSTGAPRSLGETVGYSYEQAADLRAAVYFSVIAIGANGGETHSTPADLEVCAEAREEPPIVPSVGPTLNLWASPTSISSGQSPTLVWSSPEATSCSPSGGWSGAKRISGSEVVRPTQTTTYILTCSNAGGSTTKSVVVTVSAPAGVRTIELVTPSTVGSSGSTQPTQVICRINGAQVACPGWWFSSDPSRVSVDANTGLVHYIWGSAEICVQWSVSETSPKACRTFGTP